MVGRLALMALAAAVPLVVLLNPDLAGAGSAAAGQAAVDDPRRPLGQHGHAATPTAGKPATRPRVGLRRGRRRRAEATATKSASARLPTTSAPASLETLAKQEPDGPATDLAAAVEDALEDDRPQGQAMLLLSDGIHNAGGVERLRAERRPRPRRMAAPVYTQTSAARPTVQRPRSQLQRPQELAFVGQRVPVAVSLRQRGSLAAKTTVALLLDGKAWRNATSSSKANDTVEEVFYVSHKTAGLYPLRSPRRRPAGRSHHGQ